MVSRTETQTLSETGTVAGLPVGLTVELPTFATDTFEVTADITQGTLTNDINVALVVDVSGSTRNDSGSDVDGDGDTDTFLEAQQLAAKALFQQLIDAGYPPEEVTVTLVEYNGSGNTVGNFTLDQQGAFETEIDNLVSGGSTNYDDALDEVIAEWRSTTTDGNADDSPPSEVTANDTNLMVFLSDGFPTSGGTDFTSELNILENEFDTTITAIGLGANSSVTQLNVIDNTGGADQVTDLSQLTDIIGSAPPLPDLQYVEIVVDGVVLDTIPKDQLIETPLGFRLDCFEVDGYPYILGDDLEVEVRAVFEPGAEVLTVGTVTIPMIICFVAGVRILTPKGYVPVETLEEGDRVITRDHGTQALRWVGKTVLPASMLRDRPELRPVRIKAGAFGPDEPMQDLRVSRQHRILVRDWRSQVMFGEEGGVLAPALSLINDDTIITEAPDQDVEYIHLAFDAHEVVYAEGVEAESFHPFGQTVAKLTPEQRAELFAIFPELESASGEAYPSARHQLKAKEGRVLQ